MVRFSFSSSDFQRIGHFSRSVCLVVVNPLVPRCSLSVQTMHSTCVRAFHPTEIRQINLAAHCSSKHSIFIFAVFNRNTCLMKPRLKIWKPLPLNTNYYHSTQTITTQHKLLPLNTSYYHSTQTITTQHKLLPLNTNYYHSTQTITTQHKLLPLNTNYYFCEP